MPKANLLSALQQAIQDGYFTDYVLNPEGDLVPFDAAEPVNPKVIKIVPCLSCGATLYLIEDGNCKGTIIHYWDI